MKKQFRFLALAALLALPLAACDEGNDTANVAPVTGSITGSVTADGTGLAGVTVTLSSGTTQTTNSSGQYTFSSIASGSYTVTISGAPSDVAFPSTTSAAVIAKSGDVIAVNFAGSRVRTSSILGSVTSSGVGVAGVAVTIAGPDNKSATTDANGQYSSTGLRAGSYTVSITAPTNNTCTALTQTIAVAAGEAKVANFQCTPSSTGTIKGILFVDANPANGVFDGASLEDTIKAANIAVTLEGPTLGNTKTVQSTAGGTFSFTNLAPGTYNVKIDAASPNIPAGYTYSGTAQYTVTVAPGGTVTQNFPFSITSETIKVYAYTGRDAQATGLSTSIPGTGAPVPGVIIDLYPTEADAAGGTNKLGRDTTDVNGETQFTFLRSADTSPAGAVPDQIVFASFVSAPTLYTVNGEQQIEIRYNPRAQTGLAGDTFNVLSSRIAMQFRAVGSTTGQALSGWAGAMWLNDTTTTARQSTVSDANGKLFFVDTIGPASLPATYYMRLSATQAAAAGHTFSQSPAVDRGAIAGTMLKYVFSGTVLTSDTVHVGDEKVTFTTADVMINVYHERDDSVAGGPARRSSGDNIENADNIQVELRWRQSGAATDSVRLYHADAIDGVYVFQNVPTGQFPYTFKARSLVPFQTVLPDSVLTVASGSTQVDLAGGTISPLFCPLGQNNLTNCATFGFKYNNGAVNVVTKSSDGTAASGLSVTVAPTAGTIAGTAAQTKTTDTNGIAAFTGLNEGKYTVTTSGSSTVQVVTNGAVTDTVQNNGDVDIVNVTVRRLDTSIRGVVVNDRDADNVVDPGEALSGVIIQLYRSNGTTSTAAVTLDTLAASTTTDANGAYTFSNLPEARYIVKALQPGTATVYASGITSSGSAIDTTIVRTAASNADSSNSRRQVGSTNPSPLPRWDYNNSAVLFNGRTNFTFLYNNTKAMGVIKTGAGVPVAGMTVTLQRCLISAGATKPPAAGTCTSNFPNAAPITATTDATGTFTFSNLPEGVYQVTPNPASAGLTAVAPNSDLYLQQGNGDIESASFTAT